MTKDRTKISCCEAHPPVGLSYCSQSHRFFISIESFRNGEMKIKHKVQRKETLYDLLKPKEKVMPVRSGEIYQNGLTVKARGKIKLAARIFQWQVLDGQTEKAYASMITLTYGEHWPSDHQTKKHLDNFFKRVKRKYPHFQYIWVIEKQKRGAGHYHILTPQYIPKELINKWWNGIVGKWQRSQINNGCKQQEVYPHVQKVYEAGKYMTKYLQKEGEKIGGNMYGIDQATRALMKPNAITLEGTEDLNEVCDQLGHVLTHKDGVAFTNEDFYGNTHKWISKINEAHLMEFLKYSTVELNLKQHGEY